MGVDENHCSGCDECLHVDCFSACELCCEASDLCEDCDNPNNYFYSGKLFVCDRCIRRFEPYIDYEYIDDDKLQNYKIKKDNFLGQIQKRKNIFQMKMNRENFLNRTKILKCETKIKQYEDAIIQLKVNLIELKNKIL